MLTAYFRPGTYDLLRKNCNSFTSASERLGFTVELFFVFPSKVICFSEGVASHATYHQNGCLQQQKQLTPRCVCVCV